MQTVLLESATQHANTMMPAYYAFSDAGIFDALCMCNVRT